LDKKGREQGTAILLVGVLEIEVEIGYKGQSSPAHILQISDDFGANQHISLEYLDVVKEVLTKLRFYRNQLWREIREQ
jgi:hypothetical protein